MTGRVKRIVGAIAGIAAIGALLWARSLAAWRPQSVTVLPKNYAAFYFSQDGRFLTAQKLSARSALLPDDKPYDFTTFDLQRGQSYQWPVLADMKTDPNPEFGWASPFYWQRKSSKAGDVLELQDPTTRQVKHRLSYRKMDRFPSTTLKIEGNVARVVNAFFYQEFDLTHDRLTRFVKLDAPFAPASALEGMPLYALSPDGKRIYGCMNTQGRVWEASNGQLLKRWTFRTPASPVGFSPDASLTIYQGNDETDSTRWDFVDSLTGKAKWTKKFDAYTRPIFCSKKTEVIIPQQKNCEIRDASTGRVMRRLPGPRLADPTPFAATPDWIYTDDTQGHILRWRAR